MDADHAFAAVDGGFKRVWELPDPREQLTELIRVAAEVDPVRACDRTREVAVQLRKLKLPTARRVAWDRFAFAVAPQDHVLRDALLHLAIIDARVALADADLWKPEVVPPGSIPFGNPQVMRDFEKQLLEYQVRIWQAVLEYDTDRPKAIRLTTALLADAKAKGQCHLGCISRSYDQSVADELAGLHADLYLAVIPKVWDVKLVAGMCGGRAYSRWLDRQKDSFTGAYAEYAIKNGVTRADVIIVFAHYNWPKAWAIVDGLPDDSNSTKFPRRGPMNRLIAMWAWRDPDAALAAAEKEPGESARRDLIETVARVWAQKRPDQIERAVENQDNAERQSWARDAATAELAWRKQGNPPRDTPETAPRPKDSPRPKPAGTPWKPSADVEKMLADKSRVEEADKLLCGIASVLPADHAVECIARIRSPQFYVNAAVYTARNLIRRGEGD